VLCEAVGSANKNRKTFKTFLFFTRKKKQKNLTSATSAKGGFALVPFKRWQGTGSIFLRKPFKKISTFKPLSSFILSVFVLLTESQTQQK